MAFNRACLCTAVKNAFKNVSHVIFDCDGILLDTEGIYKRVWGEIAKEHGKVYTYKLQMKVMGIPDTDGAKIYLKELQIPLTQNNFLTTFRQRASALLPTCTAMPGAEQLVKHLHKNNIPIAVATSSTQKSLEIKSTKHKEMFSLFHHIVAGGSDPEVKHGKPNPDIYLICASRFNDKPAPEKCLVFEDAPNGVIAATSAGMQCVMVPDPQVEPELTQHATMVIKSLEEVQLDLFGLPPLR